MAVLFLMSGGNFAFNFNGSIIPGISTSISGNMVSNAPSSGGQNTYAFGPNNASLRTGNLGGNYTTLYAGFRIYIGFFSNTNLILFSDSSGGAQCELRINTSGQLQFARNGTIIGATSSYALSALSWNYIEFKASLSTTSGTCEARVNGQVVVSSSGIINGLNTATAAMVQFQGQATPTYFKDMYILEPANGINTTYLGDIAVQEVYPVGPGVNSQWTNSAGPFSITSVAAGTGVYTGTITGGAANAYTGYFFNTSAFAAANNGTFLCTASTATTLTLANPASVTDTIGSAAFQAIVQQGIGQIGTRPNGDAAYIIDSTAGHISDYAHTAFSSPSSSIAAVSHLTYARKDDVGTRQIAQAAIIGGTTALATVSLGNSYQYYQQVLDADPNANAWTIANYNATTFGVKEIT